MVLPHRRRAAKLAGPVIRHPPGTAGCRGANKKERKRREAAWLRQRLADYGMDLPVDDPPYIPAFFMAAQHLVRRDRTEEARAILRDGIEQARQQADAHAASEMSEFLAELGSA